MFTILYISIRFFLYNGEIETGDDIVYALASIIFDPITCVFAAVLITASIYARLHVKKLHNKYLAGGVMAGALYLMLMAALMPRIVFNLPDSMLPMFFIISYAAGICIASLIFIVISISKGQGIIEGLINMLDFELQGIFWLTIAILCLMAFCIPIVMYLFVLGMDNDDL